MEEKSNTLLEWALLYAKKGWPVIALHTPTKSSCSCHDPLCRNRGKHPRYDKKLLKNGTHSGTTDPEMLAKWWEKWPEANIGISTGKKSFDALDVDLRGDGPETLKDLEEKHGEVPDTIEQITGSGGRQVMFTYCGGLVGNRVRFAEGLDTRSDGGLVVVPPSLHESGKRYRWEASSDPFDGKELAQMPQWLLGEILQNRKKYGNNGTGVDVAKILSGVPEGERDAELFRYACRLRTIGLQRPEAEACVLNAAAKCIPPFDEKIALRKVVQAWRYELPPITDNDYPGPIHEEVTGVTKVTSVTEVTESNQMLLEVTRSNQEVTRTYKAAQERNLSHEVREWLTTCDGTFTIQNLAQELQLYNDKSTSALLLNNLKKILHNLKNTEAIERVGSIRGVYRKIDTSLEEVPWWEASLEEYPITLPFGLSDLVKIMPKSIIICAGEKNAAKSAFAYNVARLNIPTFKCRFFNSESSPEEYKDRLTSFQDLDMDFWRKMPMYEKSQNIEDFVFPEDLNIIDFLEIHDEFWKIGLTLRKIHDRLRQGVAVVNLQKNQGTDRGKGGNFSAEKARLYVAMSLHKDDRGMIYNKIKVVDAKLWRDKNRNPNGLVKHFRVYAGAVITEITDWHYEKGRN